MSRTRPRTKPRKLPRQERSKATVDALLQAATYILIRSGWEHFTTNAVAERAGVNIASLYQYFPNKEAIVAELQRRHVEEARVRLLARLSAPIERRSLRATIERFVRDGVEDHKVAPALHRVFTEELPRSARRLPPEDPSTSRLLEEALRSFSTNVPDASLASFVVQVSAHAIIHEAASRRPELLDHPEFVGEIVTLVERYLRRPRRRR